MFRRVVAVGAISLGLIAVVPAAAASATMHPQVIGVGITTCPDNGGGTMTFTPALVTTGASGTEHVTIVATGKPCAGGSPVPHSFTLKAAATISGPGVNTCSDFFSATPPGATVPISASFAGTISFGAGITNSTLNFTTMKSKDTTSAAAVKFKASPLTITPSYHTTTGVLTVKTIATAGTLNTDCGGAGVSGVDFTSTGSGTF
ncbi:MAG: hypothetical protein WAM97_00205 [Acidimicrobiales bacterium]